MRDLTRLRLFSAIGAAVGTACFGYAVLSEAYEGYALSVVGLITLVSAVTLAVLVERGVRRGHRP
ncbi:hypothetical protein [Streptomyces bohaiensis]|uniref:Uncharacterized protein n=1 Tax=Streptomyces bohaiensis TaxID=1431344 RepID=A0ABX1C8Q0_9ACTN|nr:hypothetical protein [Streptomyces bohaiensis]NJQ15525.1 hypothetical protein [Streptomyces bohaiensis]